MSCRSKAEMYTANQASLENYTQHLLELLLKMSLYVDHICVTTAVFASYYNSYNIITNILRIIQIKAVG